MAAAKASESQTDVIVNEVSREEGWEMLEQQAQRYLGMSARAFVDAWESGQFDDDADRPEVMRVALLIPFTR